MCVQVSRCFGSLAAFNRAGGFEVVFEGESLRDAWAENKQLDPVEILRYAAWRLGDEPPSQQRYCALQLLSNAQLYLISPEIYRNYHRSVSTVEYIWNPRRVGGNPKKKS